MAEESGGKILTYIWDTMIDIIFLVMSSKEFFLIMGKQKVSFIHYSKYSLFATRMLCKISAQFWGSEECQQQCS